MKVCLSVLYVMSVLHELFHQGLSVLHVMSVLHAMFHQDVCLTCDVSIACDVPFCQGLS